MTRNSLICKLIKAQARIPENKENKIENEHELSKLTTAPPKDTAALDNNMTGTYNPSPGHIP